MTDQPSTAQWLALWLPAVDPAADDRERARRLRRGLVMLDDWDRAVQELHAEWLARLAELEDEAPAP